MPGKFMLYAQKCQHPADRLAFDVTGSIRFIAGEVVDDQADHVYCRACGRDVTRWYERREQAAADMRPVVAI